MTKSLKGLSGRANYITTTEEFISGRMAATLVQPAEKFSDDAQGFDFDWASLAPTHSRIPTWTDKERPSEMCPVSFSSIKPYGLANGYFTTDAFDRPISNLTIPGSIMDEGVVNMTAPGTVTGVIDFDGDTDDITITLTAGQTYMISLRGTGATPVGDTFLLLLDGGNAEVYHDDDGGNGTYSLMTITAAVTGTYTIRAGTFPNPGSPDLGEYTVDVRVQGADSVGNTNATAVAINQGTTFGFREVGGGTAGPDVDRYAVTLEAGKFYTFKVAGGSDYESGYYEPNTSSFGEMDTLIALRNTAGTILVQGDDNNFPDDLSSSVGFFATVSGTYYLDVTGYAGSTGGYVLDFEEIDLSSLDPLDAIRWFSADNIDTVDVGGTPTAYVYFGAAGEDFGEGRTTLGWNAFEKAAVFEALLEFTKITGIQYAETGDISQAEFRLNTVNDPAASFGAYFYPQDPAFGTQEGIGIFNVISGGWNFVSGGIQPALLKGGFAFAVILHEFGHAHGLAHAHDNGGGSDVLAGVTAAQGSLGVFNLNQGVYTVMSYNDAWWLHPDGHFGGPADPTRVGGLTTTNIDNGWSATLSAFDIAVLQERYGVHDFNVTDTVYALSDVPNAANYQCIWDSGGIDTIAYGGGLQATIDLTAATLDYSATGGGVISYVIDPAVIGIPAPTSALRGGLTIANGVIIENASGGDGNDTLLGNAAANVLTGNFGNDTLVGRGGDDTLNGGVGNDTARYFGARADYTIHAVITNGLITGYTVTDDNTANGNDGTDTLNGMEIAQFNDVSVSLVGAVAVFDADGDLVSVHTTIQAAINAATTLDGYSILVSRGVYAEDVNVTKDLTIQGANEGVAGDDTRGLETSIRSLVITASGVTVDGVLVYGQFTHPSSGGLPSGIYVAGNNFSLVNSVLDSSTATQYGILTQAVTGLDVGNNLFTNYPQGIYVSSGGSTGSIHDNLFQGDGPGSGTGLQNGVLSESNLLLIENNTFDGIDGGSIYALPQGPGSTLDLLDIIIDNIITNSGAERPIQIYPSVGTPNVLGTDENEAFVGDWGGLAGVDLSFDGRGGNDHVYGDSGNDDFEGGTGSDRLYGADGSDALNGGTDNDLLDGGAGIDTAEFADGALGYTDTAIGWLIASSEGNDFVQNVEIVTADGNRNLLVGGSGFTGIQAALNAAENGDNVRLAAATYTGSWAYSDSGLTVIAQPGAQINGTFTTAGTDGITVLGANLVDHITTGAGGDYLSGGGGADVLTGGAGNDTYIVDNAGDQVVEAAAGGADIVFTSVSYTLAAGQDIEALSTLDWTGTAALNLTGNGLDNSLFGNAGANQLDGGAGADVLQGLGGNDNYIIDNVNDRVFEAVGGGANDIVFSSVSYTLTDGQEVETLSTLDWGSVAALNLTGNSNANSLFGNAGANVLDGGLGADALYGQGGADVFAFTTTLGGGNADLIGDFLSGTDKIGLDDGIFGGIGTPGSFNANAFVAGSAALDADDRIVYNQATGQLFYDADGSGAGAQVLFATIAGAPVLTASDFSVI